MRGSGVGLRYDRGSLLAVRLLLLATQVDHLLQRLLGRRAASYLEELLGIQVRRVTARLRGLLVAVRLVVECSLRRR